MVGLGELLPHLTHVVTHGRQWVFRPRLCPCGFAGRAELRLPGCAGKPCLAALHAFVQFDYVYVHISTHA